MAAQLDRPKRRLPSMSTGQIVAGAVGLVIAVYLWQSLIARDVLVINRYTETIFVRVNGVPCYPSIPPRSHLFSWLAFCLTREHANIGIYRQNGSLIKTQAFTANSEQESYPNLMVVDVNP
jgi:hypothetical protein